LADSKETIIFVVENKWLSRPMHSDIILSLFLETVEVCGIKSIELNACILSGINIEWLWVKG
jgi:hypothetical protein